MEGDLQNWDERRIKLTWICIIGIIKASLTLVHDREAVPGSFKNSHCPINDLNHC